ncbi:MAG: hypothetical protein ACKERG_01830 [Candidatus Hodgkinia cicadicola]
MRRGLVVAAVAFMWPIACFATIADGSHQLVLIKMLFGRAWIVFCDDA